MCKRQETVKSGATVTKEHANPTRRPINIWGPTLMCGSRNLVFWVLTVSVIFLSQKPHSLFLLLLVLCCAPFTLQWQRSVKKLKDLPCVMEIGSIKQEVLPSIFLLTEIIPSLIFSFSEKTELCHTIISLRAFCVTEYANHFITCVVCMLVCVSGRVFGRSLKLMVGIFLNLFPLYSVRQGLR